MRLLPASLILLALSPQVSKYETRTEVVLLHVNVGDGRARPVADLPPEAFAVYEGAERRPIAFFSTEDSPATVGLVVDASTSMHQKRESITAAGIAFARATHPRDEIFTVHFNERVWFGLPPGQPFTSDPGVLGAALGRAGARGRTALYDATIAAVAHVERGSHSRRALIVVSDGGDNASRASFDDLLAAVRRSGALVYTVSITDEYDGDTDPDRLERLASASGALSFSPRDAGDVAGILERIAKDVHGGYTVGFASLAPAGEYRDVRVEVTAPGRRLTARTRQGHAGH